MHSRAIKISATTSESNEGDKKYFVDKKQLSIIVGRLSFEEKKLQVQEWHRFETLQPYSWFTFTLPLSESYSVQDTKRSFPKNSYFESFVDWPYKNRSPATNKVKQPLCDTIISQWISTNKISLERSLHYLNKHSLVWKIKQDMASLQPFEVTWVIDFALDRSTGGLDFANCLLW